MAHHVKANIRARPWKKNIPPSKILVMRFQALGDTVITLPYLQSLKRQYPEIELHFLTREEVSPIPKNIVLFDKVITIGGGRNAKIQFLLTLLKLPWLILQRYDAVLDLQNHKISCIVRKFLFAKAWAEFDIDRNTTLSAGKRTKQTIEALWRWEVKLDTKFNIQNKGNDLELLKRNGWEADRELIVLNPAGFSPSRNWPLQHYVEFAKLWMEKVNARAQFVLLLLPEHESKATYLSNELGEHCLNFTGNANQVTAFSIIQRSSLMLSEDSGLMHMAWVQGIPTVALFSSSRKDWSAPQGEWSYCFDSSDLECGPCMQEVCQYGDNRCITRYTPEIVLQKAMSLHGKK